MKVAITGSSGLVGKALQARLVALGHEVIPIHRGDPSDPHATWKPSQKWIREGAFDGVDAVINLSGANLGAKRWTDDRKAELVSSRVDLTRFLVEHLGPLSNGPKVLVQASAVGIYGPHGDEALTEASPPGEGFLADLCKRWEAEAANARSHGIRVTVVRSGVVLAKEGGAIGKMLLPFKLGMGGRIGSGKQYMSWVSLRDAVNGYVYALEHGPDGAMNLTSPNPVTNARFTKALGGALHRPTLLPVPTPALYVLFGKQMPKEMLIEGQRVVPQYLEGTDFEFQDPTISGALDTAFAKSA